MLFLFVLRSAAGRHDVFLFDLIDVEPLHLAPDRVEQILQGRRLLHEAQGIRACDHEGFQIRADETLRLPRSFLRGVNVSKCSWPWEEGVRR